MSSPWWQRQRWSWYGYEITAADVAAAYTATVKAARNTGCLDEIRGRIGALVADGRPRSDFIAPFVGKLQ